jgi:hypothetical protein
VFLPVLLLTKRSQNITIRLTSFFGAARGSTEDMRDLNKGCRFSLSLHLPKLLIWACLCVVHYLRPIAIPSPDKLSSAEKYHHSPAISAAYDSFICHAVNDADKVALMRIIMLGVLIPPLANITHISCDRDMALRKRLAHTACGVILAYPELPQSRQIESIIIGHSACKALSFDLIRLM